jgi:cytidine deaminase
VWDLCGDIPIFITDKNGKIDETTSAELLPDAFDQSMLK